MTEEKIREQLEHKLLKLEAQEACRNLMGRYSYYGTAFRNKETVELWAKREDAQLMTPWGSYDGHALNYKGTMWSPGYSYEFFGGDTTYCVIPAEVMELGCLLEYKGRAYYEASLAEPMSCSIGAFHAAYHTQMGVYTHEMGIKENGKLAIMAGAGPMGLGALTYALHRDVRPSMVVVTDLNQDRLDRAEELFPVETYKKEGIELHFVNTGKLEDPVAELIRISADNFLSAIVPYTAQKYVQVHDALHQSHKFLSRHSQYRNDDPHLL